MGIFPYQTPVEFNRSMRNIQHFNDFVKLKGYEILFDHGCGPHPWQDKDGRIRTDSSAPWLGKNGKTYTDREEFRKDNGWYPYLIKDGVCYGWAEPRTLDGYKDPWGEEVKFLESRGYTRAKTGFFSDDYIANIKTEEAFYKKHGWLPRWEKDGTQYGHEQLLVELEYEYPGEPEFPVLVPSDLEIPVRRW